MERQYRIREIVIGGGSSFLPQTRCVFDSGITTNWTSLKKGCSSMKCAENAIELSREMEQEDVTIIDVIDHTA